MLANPKLFGLDKLKKEELGPKAYELAEKVSKQKTDFALKYAITTTDWNVPRYIREGLKWLARPASITPTPTPPVATAPRKKVKPGGKGA